MDVVIAILGSIGGIIYLIKNAILAIKAFGRWHRKYRRMKYYWEDHHAIKVKPTMGFKTRDELDEFPVEEGA